MVDGGEEEGLENKNSFACLSWDEYFMSLAELTSKRSKDPVTRVGACIVNSDNKIVGVGYNGFPSLGDVCNDQVLSWKNSSEDPLDTKYPFVCHAEVNAILNKNQEILKDCRIYSTLFPCNECAKIIIQSGIQKVIYLSDRKSGSVAMRASRRMFDLARVELICYDGQRKVTIN